MTSLTPYFAKSQYLMKKYEEHISRFPISPNFQLQFKIQLIDVSSSAYWKIYRLWNERMVGGALATGSCGCRWISSLGCSSQVQTGVDAFKNRHVYTCIQYIYIRIHIIRCYHRIHIIPLYYTILYYTILYYTILYYTILYYTILYYTILYYTILYYTILYYTILYYTILYYTILYYTILYYTILLHASTIITIYHSHI